MTYAIVTAILILALFAVVVAVVFMTDEDHATESDEIPAPSDGQLELNQMQPSREAFVTMQQKENQARDIRIVDLPQETDRNSGPVGI